MKNGEVFGIAIALSVSLAPVARAETDTLLPLTFKTFPVELKRALARVSVRDELTSLWCLPGDKEKAMVCTYKLGTYLTMTTQSDKGATDMVGITMICATAVPTESAKCLLAFSAALTIAGGDATREGKAKVMSVLIDGLDIGNSDEIMTDDRKFGMQKGMGLWLTIYAADAAASQ